MFNKSLKLCDFLIFLEGKKNYICYFDSKFKKYRGRFCYMYFCRIFEPILYYIFFIGLSRSRGCSLKIPLLFNLSISSVMLLTEQYKASCYNVLPHCLSLTLSPRKSLFSNFNISCSYIDKAAIRGLFSNYVA